MNRHPFRLGLYTCTFASFIIAAAAPANASWRQTEGPIGGSTFLIASDGQSALTAGSAGGVFRSTDGGQSWHLEFEGLSLTDSLSQLVAVGPGTYFAVSGRGAWRSTDGGLSWEAVNAGLDLHSVELRVFNGTAYAIGRNAGNQNELRVYDQGLNEWVLISTPEPPGDVFTIGNLMVVPNDVAYDTHVMRSFDYGETWEVFDDPNFPILGFTNLTMLSGSILAVSPSDGIWHSLDYGQEWERIVPASQIAANELTQVDGDLYAISYGGELFRSTDVGYNWTQVNNGVANIRAIASDNGRLLVAANRVYRSDNDAASWTLSADGIIATPIGSFQTIGNELEATEAGRTGLHSSQDGGETWQYDPNSVPAGVEVVTVFAYDGNTYLLGTRLHGIYRSTNGGQSWTPANNGWPMYHSDAFSTSYHRPVGFARIGNDIFVAGGGSQEVIGGTIGAPQTTSSGAGVYKSSDQGQTWQAVRSGLPIKMTNPLYGNPIYASAVRMEHFGNTMLVSLDGYGIYRSATLGASWQNASTGLPLYQGSVWLRASTFYSVFGTIVVTDRAVNALDPQPALYASYDDGQSWSMWSVGPGQQQGVKDLVFAGGQIIAAVAMNFSAPDSPTFYASSDFGQTWEALQQNVPGLYANDLWSDGTSVLAATNLGVWRLASVVVGDLNCDAQLDFGDINPFVQVLTAPAAYAAEHPTCDATLADMNGDGAVDFGDINPLVAALLQ